MKETKIPCYDKSAFGGQGDRTAEDTWLVVNQAGQPPIKVVLFEGWCVGFRPLSDSEVKGKWKDAVTQAEEGDYHGKLGLNKIDDVEFVNRALRGYDKLTNQLDALIHLDAADPRSVYRWRAEQESVLRETRGSGMTDEQVQHFVDGYYPAYELFTDRLRSGIFDRGKGKQMRLVIGEDREVRNLAFL